MSLTYTADITRKISGDYDVCVGREYFLFASICVRNGIDLDEAAGYLPPTGTTGGWRPVAAEDMEPHMAPVPCPDHPKTHTHHAYSC